MTRLLREHPRIDVELDAVGRLTAISWNGRREAVEVCNRWRVEEAWWRDPIRLGILAVAALMLYAVWWLATSPTGSTAPANHEIKKRETKPVKRKLKSAHVPSTDISSHT